MYCAKCDVCCRFLDEETPLAPLDTLTVPQLSKKCLTGLAPAGLTLKPYRDRFICCSFDPINNRCNDYKNRPFDCRLYPLVIMWDEEYRDVVLGVDTKCPCIKKFQIPNPKFQTNSKSQIPNKFKKYKNHILTALKDIDACYILRFQDDVEILEKLDVKVKPALNKLLIGDKALFEKYAKRRERPFSGYSFAANYVWTGLLDYRWMIIDDNFCLFCKTRDTIFMPIPPLGERVSGAAAEKCFELMNKINKNKLCSRIEDIRGKDAEFYEGLGYTIKEKGREYIYNRDDLTQLAGDRYKDKRALCNYFMKNYKYGYREYRPDDMKACLGLYRRWAANKGTVPIGNRPLNGAYYRALLEDSYIAHKKAMDRFRDLGLAGRVVVVDNKISAYTFGYRLDEETFVVLFEIVDLRIKGLSQFIFRQFCAESGDCKYINAMDDSGLENLKRVKMSYRPVKVERTYCVYA